VTRARGLWVAFLGPDGAGKSTVIERIERDLADCFSEVRRFHLRPHFGLRGPDGPPVLDPHGRRPRGRLGSLAKLGWWWADAVLGYAIAVRPVLRRHGLVLFDRTLDDVVVDPHRYRYRGSAALARAAARGAPRPHVVVVLDAPDAVLRDRKREVAPEETARQRRAYRALASRLPGAVLVDASRAIDEVVGEIRGIVLRAAGQEFAVEAAVQGAR